MAAEFAASTAANGVGNLTTEYASPYVSYFFRFGKIAKEFNIKRKDLQSKKNRIRHDVDEAIRQTEVIEEDVQDWVERAEKELKETQSLEAEIERMKCFNWCPSWGWRYCLSMKVAKKTISINKLLESYNFPRMGYRPPLQGIEFFPSNDFMPSESSNSTFNEITRALNTNGVNMIGLYGMPGVGKTTLAKEVGKHAREQKLFDKVVMATMSETPDINKIQDKIAELLGLKFEASTEEGKAEELWRRLKGEEKILIIIDDVWNEFKLQTVGIPFGVQHEGCKILLTTRSEQVCDHMKCQKFHLGILSEDEAWDLFKDNAGLNDVSLALNDVAKEVARECKGLPLAIVVIAKALSGEDLDEWKAANQRLKDSRHSDNEDVCEGLYNRLKLSYDHLKGHDIRSCFLLCSLFPEDFHIGVEWLIMFGIGYGLFSDVYSIQHIRMEICVALRKLQKSGLLLKIDDREGAYDNEVYVSMHDVVRDFAHWLTLREKNIFMVKEGLTEWPKSESCGCYTAISFWNSKINNFPNKLEFSELKILVFRGKNFLRISSTVVKGMKALRVLHLENISFSLEVLKFVTDLRTLCFVNCELENISSLRNMEKLEILAFSDTNIYELPEELVVLHELKSLHFSHSGSKQINFPPNLLSRLTSLQELHVTCKNNVYLSELNSLSRLTALSMIVSTAQCFPENFVFPKLQRYIIAVNEDLPFMQGLNFRTLDITEFASSLSAFKKLFYNVEKLALENVMGHKNIVPDVDPKGLNELTSLELKKCDDMECLMDTTGEKGPTTAFSNLVKLRMRNVTCLKELCHGPPPISFLQKLNDVTIIYCKQLKVVFEMDGLLEKGEISQTPLFSNLTSLSLNSLPELESIWKLQSAHQYHASLQSLKVARISECGELKSIFPPCLAQSLLHLQELDISRCNRLEQVFDFPQEMTELQVQPLSNLTSLELVSLPELKWIWKGPTHLVKLRSLKTMRINMCLKLAHLFPTPLAQSLLHLQRLYVQFCKGLEQIFNFSQEMVELEVRPLSDLTYLALESLPELKWIWKGPTHLVKFQSLETIRIKKCLKVAYLFPTPLAQSLVHLEELEISHCDSLEHIVFEEAENEDEMVSNMEDCPLCWPKLRTLEIINCERLKYVFPITLAQGLPYLESIQITDCSQLEHVFDVTKDKDGRPPQEGPTHLVELRSLKTMRIQKCLKLAYLFPTPLAHSLLHLQQLSVQFCEGLEQIFNFSQEMVELEVRPLSDLTYLELSALPELKWIWKGPIHLVKLQSLKTMRIEKCLKVVYLFPTPLAQSLVHLEELKISHCDSMEHIIFGEAENEDEIVSNMDDCPLCWPKLRTLKIINCERLKYVFPITLAQGLPYLESIQITDCSQLEHVFDVTKDKDGRPPQDIVLQRLQILRLKNLEKLNSFCSENSVMSLSLKEIEVSNCLQLTDRGIKTLQAHLKDVSLYGFKELLCNTKNLTADEIIYPKNLIPNVDPEGLNELTFLALKHGKEWECLIDTTDQGHVSTTPLLSNLTSLELESLPELKWIWKGPRHYVCLQSLKVAEISRCNRLKYLFSPSLAQNLVMLEQLKIEYCDELECIATELESDDNIESDGGLLHPLLLPKLTYLEIHACPRLQYLFNVAKEKNGVDHAIVLPHLQCLQPGNLINLSSFCAENYPIVSPSLEKLILVGCPQLENFIIQQAIHKQLQPQELRFSELRQDNMCNNVNLENTFQIQGGHLLSRIEVLNLDDINQLQGPIQVASLPYLKHLNVLNCNRLKSLFSSMLAQNLPQLKFLDIECCGELQEIIEMDQTSIASSSQGHLHPISFPSLQWIQISGCGNLKSLFPISATRSLSNLRHMYIKRASKLEQVFGCQGGLNIEDDQKGIVLPKFQVLCLHELSSLKSFAPMGYHFRFPSLFRFDINKSPKLTTSVIMGSKHPVPTITEEPQQVQNNTTKGFTTMEEIVDNQSTCNDIRWYRSWGGKIPLYMTVGETRIMLCEEEVKNSGETC
ncbi:uncharacterized protein LOC111288713 [Durio zibethinus]|uniref:Uncharacterized protein LOC111288713 n=1 Tax=Durio zibethinus TaxID=66656 RepID=A0A6P5Y4T3_DURZI|nr:uncharacterized protein LOC111288713 [Durio zibethinus]XP_022735451.1 uncharacterized protein LOC111288713 [Durio zibethinus]XP_022735453.1 uncharacterized protein LOC111288713 [Durio zibethinus]